MEEQSSACINNSSSSTTVKPSYDSPMIKYDYVFNTDLSRSGAIQQKSFNKSAIEADDKSRIQLLNPSVLHQDSSSQSAAKYDDVCNPEDLKSGATYQNNSEANPTQKYDDVCRVEPSISSLIQFQDSGDAIKMNGSGYINDYQLSTVPSQSNTSKNSIKMNGQDRSSYTPKLPLRDNLSKTHAKQHRNLPQENNLYFEIDEQLHLQNHDLNRKQKQAKCKGKSFRISLSCKVLRINFDNF